MRTHVNSRPLTQSIAKILVEQSPAHARIAHPRLTTPEEEEPDEPEKYIKAQAIGSACHAKLIGRGKLIAVAMFDSWRSKDARAFKEEMIAEGRTYILAKHFEAADLTVKAVRAQLDAAGWNDAFTQGDGEVVLCWQEGKGIWLRTMIDWLTPDLRHCYDLKTSGVSIAPHGIGYKIDEDGWDIQAAMHERGLAVLDPEGRGRRRYRFPIIENKKPHALLPVELGEHHLAIGRRKLAVAINLWSRCIETGEWPAYAATPIIPDVPPVREARWIEREAAMCAEGLWSLEDPLILGAPQPPRAGQVTEPV